MPGLGGVVSRNRLRVPQLATERQPHEYRRSNFLDHFQHVSNKHHHSGAWRSYARQPGICGWCENIPCTLGRKLPCITDDGSANRGIRKGTQGASPAFGKESGFPLALFRFAHAASSAASAPVLAAASAFKARNVDCAFDTCTLRRHAIGLIGFISRRLLWCKVGQIGPDLPEVVRAQLLAGDCVVRFALNHHAQFSARNTSVLPSRQLRQVDW
jgi:hypothetical protein